MEGFGSSLDDPGVHHVGRRTSEVDGGASVAGCGRRSQVGEVRACSLDDDDFSWACGEA